MLINKISSLLLLVQIFCISCVPHRFVDVEDNKPTFFRGSVEHVPLDDDLKGSLRAGAEYFEEDRQFSRAAVESVPANIVSYFQPLRSAVEHNPLDDDDYETFDTFTRPASQKKKFLKLVKADRQSKQINLAAYVIPTHPESRPQQYRSGSPYQELVDAQTFARLQQGRLEESHLKRPKISGYKVVCHITNWSFYRKGEGKFVPENLDASLCTHIIYSYATLEPEELELREFDPWGDIENQLYSRTVSLGQNKDVPVILGLGGWTDSSGDKYSRLVSNPTKRANFIKRGVAFLRQYGFSGCHIDWNYPVCWQSDCRAGPSTDKDDFTKFISELRKAFNPYGLLLTVAISGYKEVIAKAYDLTSLSSSVDFFTVMSYDYHGSWETVTGHVSPLYGDENDKYPQYNTDYALKLLVKLGAEKEKLVVGVPFYGQSFTLTTLNPNQGFNSPSDGPGEPGEVTNQPGMYAYSEICNRLRRPGWKMGTDPTGKSGPYATDGSQWVGFDDSTSVTTKTKYVINAGYGGIAAWTVDLDDFSNRCCRESFPLLRAINRAFGRLKTPVPSGNNCERPPEPVTPVAPVMVATVDTGSAGIPGQSSTVPNYGDPQPSSTTSPWWTQPTTTTRQTTSRTSTERSTTSKTSTARPTRTTTEKKTTRTTRRPTSTISPPDTENTIIPNPVNVMPVVHEGSCEPNEIKADPTSCSSFLVCANDVLITQYCPAGLHFNDRIKNCDWIANAKCTVGNSASTPQSTTRRPQSTTRRPQSSQRPQTTQRTTTSQRTTTTARPTTTTRRQTSTTRRTTSTTRRTTTTTERKPETTTEYIEPQTTTRRPQTTTRRTSTKRPSTYYETTTSYYSSTTRKPNKKPCVNGEYYAHKDCSKYYICNNGKRTPIQCPLGTQFSQKIKTCDFEENVKCVSRKKYLKLLQQQYKQSGIYSALLLKASQGDVCDRETESFVPHPLDCSKFFRCDHGRLISQECSPGLHFDSSIDNCNWPDKVNCKKSNDETEEAVAEETDEEECDNEKEYCDEEEVVNGSNNQIPDFEFDTGAYNPPAVSSVKPSSTTQKPSTARPATSSSAKPTTSKPATSSTSFQTIPVSDNVQPLDGSYKLVCYFTNWAWYRPGIGKYLPDNIDENLCTHIVYGFAVLNYDELTIRTHDSWADIDNKFYERVVEFKNKGVKVTLAIGGWNDSAGDKYSRLVRNPAARAKFIRHVVEFLEKYGFDGLDLDWEYPVCWQVDCKKGNPDEKENFAAFVKELSDAFKPRGLLLSSAVSPSKTVIDAGYDVPTLSEYFDWIAVMCYDYHGQWDKKTGHVAPLYYHPEDDVDYFNSDYTMRYWIELGADPSKLVMGMPLYGQSFTLADPKNNGLNAKAPGPGHAGEFTRAAGFLAYYEICDRIFNHGWTVVQDPEGRMGPYAYKGNQWVSFDDQETLRRKTQFIKELGIGGGMVWALDLDDFKNRCGQGIHPLLKIIHAELQNPESSGVDAPRPPPQEDPLPQKPHEHESPEFAEENEVDVIIDEEEDSNREPLSPQNPNVDTETNEADEYDDDEENEVDTSSNSDFKVVCYFTNWAWYRQGIGKFVPEDIDPDLCTHIVYGFAVLDRDRLTIKPHDSWADIDNRFYERVIEFKNKGVKVTVAIGGWNDSAGDKYSRLVRDASARARFIKHVIEFIEKYGFEGLDLDWEYPVCWQVECEKGMADEKQYFAKFVEELSVAFKPRGLLLSSAVSPAKKVIDAGYDIPKISKYFDWIAVMAYDYHGQWDKKTGHVAPMYTHPEDWEKTFNANFSLNYWLQNGADPKKIIFGMPMYGQSFSLAERNNNGLNSQTYGGGEAGPETRARGFLSYYEICTNIRKKNWSVVRDLRGRMGPYAYSGDQWVSFDDAPMIRHKSEFVKSLGLGGAMIWALDLDDFKNVCGCEEYPLLRTINRVLRNYPGPHNNCVLESRKKIRPTTTKPGESPTKRPSESPTTMNPKPTTRKPAATTTKKLAERTTTRKTTTTTEDPDYYTDEEVPDLNDQDGQLCGSGRLFISHESDCNSYYVCNHGVPQMQHCPEGLHWNKDRCDWPQYSNCVSSDTENPADNDIDDDNFNVDVAPSKPPTQKPATQKPATQKPATQRPTTSRATARPSTPTKRPAATQKPVTQKPTNRPTRPPVNESPVVLTGNEKFMVVCYFTNWAWYRPGIGKYRPSDIDANLCTHIVYGFAVLNRETLTIRTHDSWADIDNDFYGKVAEYKSKGIKVTLAIGGWNDSLGDKYSRLVRDAAARARFIKHVVEFIKKYGFDGLDLDWEYPVCWQVDCKMGKPDEKEYFATFVQELSAAFKPEGLLLSAAVSPAKKVIDAGYDIPKISKYFDWIAVMCYDYHGQWDKKTGHVAPLYVRDDDWEPTFNANFTMHYWIDKGAPRKKLVMGMPMYGQSFALEKTVNNELNAIAPGPGQAGEFTRAAGFLAFYEICDRVNRGGWTVVRDPEGKIGPYAYNDRQWVSYDDVEDIRRKTKFVKDLGIGGAMIWALDLDDFRNRCGCGHHPLLTTINLELDRISTSRPSDCT